MLRMLRFLIAVVCYSGMDGAGVSAGPVTFHFEGEVTRVFDPEGHLPEEIAIGAPLVGSYTFESITPDANPYNSNSGHYHFAIILFDAELAGLPLTRIPELPTYIGVGSENQIDSYSAYAAVEGMELNLQVALSVIDPTGQMFLSDELPLDPFVLNSASQIFAMAPYPTESRPFSVEGSITSIVPEPGSLLLGVVATGFIIRRGKRTILCARTTHASLFLFTMLINGELTKLRAADCQPNGIPDEQEIVACKVDLVFLFDTSSSMGPDHGNPMPALCTQVNQAISTLQLSTSQVDTVSEKLRLTTDSETISCTCCTDKVSIRYGTTATGYPNVESLGACAFPGSYEEDWGPATAIVSANKVTDLETPWRSNALRFVFILTDEGPRCGGGNPDHPDDPKSRRSRGLRRRGARDSRGAR